jgi:phosphomannomutase
MNAELVARAEAWRKADPDPATQKELTDLLAGAAEAELADRFTGSLEFGTAGLRGVLGAGPNRMNRAVVLRTTAGLARYLKAHGEEARRRGVVVARDGRRLSDVFAKDAAEVLAAEGITVHFFEDVAPTPLCAFAVTQLGAAAGVMVTASHNPPEYNGYKVYWSNGAQIIPPHDKGIAAAIDQVEAANALPRMPFDEAREKGLVRILPPDIGRAYLDAILALRVHPEGGGKDLTLVYTAMHGVGGEWVVRAFQEAGFTKLHPVPEQQAPDGAFPTVRFPNPEEKGAMDLSRALADRVGADLVLANDPDADRLAVIAREATGGLRALSGNEVGVLLGHYLLTQRPVAHPLVMTTIVSSVQLSVMAEALHARYGETLTGFKWIANGALDQSRTEPTDFLFGYEEALGYTVGTVVRDKDGIGAALVFADLAAWCRTRGTTVLGYLEEIQRTFGLFLSDQRNLTLPGAEGQAVIAGILKGFRDAPPTRIGHAEVSEVRDYQRGVGDLPRSNVLAYVISDGSRITVRPSGTEPKIKYYFELREVLTATEPLSAARARAAARLEALQGAFLELAHARGQPE